MMSSKTNAMVFRKHIVLRVCLVRDLSIVPEKIWCLKVAWESVNYCLVRLGRKLLFGLDCFRALCLTVINVSRTSGMFLQNWSHAQALSFGGLSQAAVQGAKQTIYRQLPGSLQARHMGFRTATKQPLSLSRIGEYRRKYTNPLKSATRHHSLSNNVFNLLNVWRHLKSLLQINCTKWRGLVVNLIILNRIEAFCRVSDFKSL